MKILSYSTKFLKGIIATLTIALTAIGAGATYAEAEIHPADERETAFQEYRFEVGNFYDLNIQNNVNVVYTHCNDTIGHVSYKSTPEFEDAFIFTNNKGALKVQVQTDVLGKPGLPTLYVSSNNLEKVENYSDYNVRVESNIKADTFSVSLIGNGSIVVGDVDAHNVTAKITAGMGTIILSGDCTNSEFKLTGTGTIQADMLKSRNVTCRFLGGGTISTYPLVNLNVRGVGTTRIFYRGQPKIKKIGGGKLIPNI